MLRRLHISIGLHSRDISGKSVETKVEQSGIFILTVSIPSQARLNPPFASGYRFVFAWRRVDQEEPFQNVQEI
ncbi:hypothetical protein CDAR_564851 [Caerostris darwini]|uniref:Uncharacterized protein n=1 Tax=Caerostris darwini TaxID=1538125 RepID=A0AAV4Q9F5_9ARAC|nr:hypothetical protein CDAR_564851 [Caerostris darwini]